MHELGIVASELIIVVISPSKRVSADGGSGQNHCLFFINFVIVHPFEVSRILLCAYMTIDCLRY